MAKKQEAPVVPAGDVTVVGVRADGHSSMFFVLSDGTEVVALVAGAGSLASNAKNRDTLVPALQRSLGPVTVPAPE